MLGFEQPRSDLAKDRVPALWFFPHSLPSPGRNSDLPGKSEDRESASQVIGRFAPDRDAPHLSLESGPIFFL